MALPLYSLDRTGTLYMHSSFESLSLCLLKSGPVAVAV